MKILLITLKIFGLEKRSDYNYSKFIEKYKKNKQALAILYTSNNIIESLHSKINFNIPKSIPNKINYINYMKNIFNNDIIKHKIYKGYDYITKTLLKIINKEKFKMVDYTIFQRIKRKS